jgi:hypothetical protein
MVMIKLISKLYNVAAENGLLNKPRKQITVVVPETVTSSLILSVF